MIIIVIIDGQSSVCWYWDNVRDIVMRPSKTNVLTEEDDESGLLPFMATAKRSRYTQRDEDLPRLNIAYKLLCMNPGVLKEYHA